MLHDEAIALHDQLKVARSEINTLRQKIKNLQHVQRKDADSLRKLLQDFRCEGCRRLSVEENTNDATSSICGESVELECSNPLTAPSSSDINFHSIGVIRTSFPGKRAVPRQSTVGSRLRGVIELNSTVFTNPEHSVQGLNEYSHLWIIYYFHKNNSHPKAKVKPPRLDGKRVGVFSTRSPHRPCPIGLSLVEIDKIDGSKISFYGTDMVDGTPVLDIKPYIPFYDAPMYADSGRTSVGPSETIDFYNARQEPDGEEAELELLIGASGGTAGFTTTSNTNDDDTCANVASSSNFQNHIQPPTNAVRVPNWIVSSQRLKVQFNERAEHQLTELQVNKQSVIDILEADPRSVYLRTKYGSQIFTFQLNEVTVTCKFDDKAATVTVVQVRRTENVQDEELTEQC